MKRIILFALVALFVVPAQADAVYRWETVDAMGAKTPIGGEVRFTDEIWRQGSVNYDFDLCRSPSSGCPGDPSSPVLLLDFYVNNRPGNWTYHNYRAGLGFEDGQSSYVSAVFGDLLLGSMGSGGSYAMMRMASDSAGLWTISSLFTDRAASGFNDPTCWLDVCAGVTGRWALDRATIPVPTPGTLALFGLGLAALAVNRRRKM